MNESEIDCRIVLRHDDFVMQNHRVHETSVMPGVTFLDILYRILADRGADLSRVVLRNILFTEAVATAEGQDREIRVRIGADTGIHRPVTGHSRRLAADGALGDWTENLRAELHFEDLPDPAGLDVAAERRGAREHRDMAEMYAVTSSREIRHGTAMKCFGSLHTGDGRLLAELDIDREAGVPDEAFHLHPAKLDAATIVAYGQSRVAVDRPFIPMFIESFRAPRPLKGRFVVRVPRPEELSGSGELFDSDLVLYDEEGRFAAEFRRLTCKRIRHPELIQRLVTEGATEPGATGTAAADPHGPAHATAPDAAHGARSTGRPDDSAAERYAGWLRTRLGDLLGRPAARVATSTGFYELGLDSVSLLKVGQELEELVGSTLYPTLLFEYTDVDSLAQYLASTFGAPELPGLPERHGAEPEHGAAPEAPEAAPRLLARHPVWARSGHADTAEAVDLVLLGADARLTEAVCAATGDRRVVTLPVGPGSGTDDAYGPDPERIHRTLSGLGPDARPYALVDARGLDGGSRGSSPVLDVWALATALVRTAPAHPVALLRLHTVSGESADVEEEAVAALARTVTAETPVIRARAIGVDATDTPAQTAAALVTEAGLACAAASGDEAEARWSTGRRLVRRWAEVPPAAGARPGPAGSGSPYREHGVYVITGGSGGLAALLAERLATECRARIVLCSRTPANAELRARMDAWQRAGAEVHHLAADVTSRADTERLLRFTRDLFGRVDGILHCAGLVRDALYFRKKPADFEAVLAPKLWGARHLDEATAQDELDFFALFSSLSAAVANPGQSDYAYANACLDHFAARRAARTDRSGHTVSVAWPLWEEGGMQVSESALERSRRESGTVPLPTAEGIAAFERSLTGEQVRTAIAYGDADRLDALFPQADGPVEHHEPLGAVRGTAAVVQRAAAGTPAPEEDGIAVIGIAGEYPGAVDLDAYWRNLAEGRDCITEVPGERWDHEAVYAADPDTPGTTYGRWGGFLEGADRFDHAFFGISRREAERMDPQERLFLRTCWRTLEHAGYAPAALSKQAVGVFAGVMWNHYQLVRDASDGVAPTAMHAAVANRVSYVLDLHGPSMAVDTACSSSLTAVQLAMESLRRGECELALAGGVNIAAHPQKYLQLAQGRFLSTDGRCRSFGEGGDGYVPGEGVGAVLLKPLSRARADGDRVLAVLRAGFLNHTGRTSGFTVPSPTAQAAVVRGALERAGVSPHSVGYIEAHGTGTSLGDPIEIEGLRRVFAPDRPGEPGSCRIGSVKSGIGHLESAAGIAGLTKVVLQLQHRTLVPSLHAGTTNSKIDFSRTPFAVQRALEAWPAPDGGGPRRAGVSAFGAGGANAHLVVEEWVGEPADAVAAPGPELVLLSARDPEALRGSARALRDFLTAGPQAGHAPADGTASDRAPADAPRLRTALLREAAACLGVPLAAVDPAEPLADLGFARTDVLSLRERAAEVYPGHPALSALSIEDSVDGIVAELTASQADSDAGTLRLADVAHTLRVGRTAMAERLAVVAPSVSALCATLDRFLAGEPVHPDLFRTGASAPGPAAGGCATAFREGRPHEAAAAWAAGEDVDWAALVPAGAGRRIALPGHPFREERCWLGNWQAGTGQQPREERPALSERPVSEPPAPVEPYTGSEVDLQILEHGIALVTMAAGDQQNMFTDGLMHGLEWAFARIAARPEVTAVVLTGSGKVFSMGGTPEALEDLSARRTRFTDTPFVYEGLLRCGRPVIAAISGHASGGGLAFGLYADMVVMSRDAVYSSNFLKYGFTPGMGATYILDQRLGKSLATEMLLTGRPYAGAELEQRGATVTFRDRAEVLPAALALARSVAELSPQAVAALKSELAGRMLGELPAVIDREVRMHEQVLGEDSAARVRAHFGKVAEYGRTGPERSGAAPAAPVAPEPPAAVVDDPPAREPEPDAAEAEAVIAATLTEVLYLDAGELDRRLSFNEMGVDSIGAVELAKEINRAFGLSLDSVAVYDFPTLPALAEHVTRTRAQNRSLHRAASREAAPTAAEEERDEPAAPARAESVAAPAPHQPVSEDGRVRLTPPAAPAAPRTERPAAAPPGPRLVALPTPDAQPGAAPESTTPTTEQATPTTTQENTTAPDRPATQEPIAIIGAAGRFPGAPDLDTFWANLLAGRSQIREVPAERWPEDGYYDPDRRVPGRSYSKWAALLDDVGRFDARFFQVSPLEAEAMDPQQRLFLEEAWTALADAGLTDAKGKQSCGVFVGCGTGDYQTLLDEAGALETGHAFLGSSSSILAARIAYLLDLTGPTLAVDTACSSSLVALHLACESIRSGDCETAVAGGVALMTTPRMHVWTSKTGMLSPTGRSLPFDADADGIVLGEAVGVVVLKSLRKALEDGDRIHGVIRGTGVNGDGRTNGITAPSANSQANLLRSVHRKAGIAGADLGYLEAHGTGTHLGDPIEVKALDEVLRASGGTDCVLGSVKAAIGHTTTAAGISGLLALLMALRARRIPPAAHFTRLNPEIDLTGSPLRLSRTAEAWRPGPDGVRVGAVSSFGFSGTNAHVVLAEAPSPEDPAAGEAAHRETEPEPLRAHPFTRSRHWITTPETSEAPRDAEEPPRAPAAHTGHGEDSAVRTDPAAGPTTWPLDPRHPVVAHHHVAGRALLPGTATLSLALDFARSTGISGPAVISGVRWLRPLHAEARREVRAGVTAEGERYALEFTADDQPEVPFARAQVAPCGGGTTDRLDLGLLARTLPELRTGAALYRDFAAGGLGYGPAFRLVQEVRHGADEALAVLSAPAAEQGAAHWPANGVDAALLDAALQVTAVLQNGAEEGPLVPFALERAAILGPLTGPAHVHAVRTGAHTFALRIADDEGRIVARLDGLALRPLPSAPAAGLPVYVPVWQEADRAETGPEDAPPSRVMLVHGPGTRDLSGALAALHPDAEVLTADWDRAAEAIGRADLLPDRVYLLAEPTWVDAGSAREALTALHRLVRAVLDRDGAHHALDLRAVLPGAVAVPAGSGTGTGQETSTDADATAPDTDDIVPGAAALLGYCAALGTEFPRWTVGCLDPGTGRTTDDPAALARSIHAEQPVDSRPVALRAGRRLVRTFAPWTAPAKAAPLRTGGVYVVLGGTGGLGSAVCRSLARKARARLVLVGRRPRDERIDALLADLTRLGATPEYQRADAADPEAMRRVAEWTRERFGPVHGAVHAAFVLHDKTVAQLTEPVLHEVFDPKAAGAEAFCAALRDEPLDFLALFSSAISFVDAPGQAAYAAASTFEDALALRLRHRFGVPAQVVNWGYWGSVGAVAGTRYRERMAGFGVGSIEPAEGMAALDRVLAHGLPQALAIKADPEGLTRFGIDAGTSPRKEHAMPTAAPEPTQPVAPPEPAPVTDPAPTATAVRDYVRGVFAEVLKYDEAELDDRTTFEHYGVDSLVGQHVVQRFEEDLGDLPATLLFENLTIAQLAAHLQEKHAERIAELAGPGTGPAADQARDPAEEHAGQRPRTPDAVTSPTDPMDIAVVGVSGRFPRSPDIDAFWRNLAAGTHCVTEVPAERWDWRTHFDPKRGKAQHTYGRWGGFLDGIDQFDPAFFGILPKEAADIDPQERLFLETCWDLLERAGRLGEPTETPRRTGVFVGVMYGSYGRLAAAQWARGRLAGAHSAYWSVANRVSYTFDLQGPSFAVDSACSSSLTAVHLAVESLRRGECRTAIAGGVNLILHPAHLVALSSLNMLAADGACKVFDERADGYVPGEGIGAVLLKPLADAVADGDDIWGVIKGSAVNSGGRTGGYTVPNPQAQARLIADAVEDCGIDPRTLGYIEAHGTGTALGDPIEIAGLRRAFGERPPRDCAIGSVKASVGHLEGAAGVAGLIKALLQLRHKQLTPCVNLGELNPRIDTDGWSFAMPRELTFWESPVDDEGRRLPRTAGVSSFGAGGANAHVLLQEYVPDPDRPRHTPAREGEEQLFLLSARTEPQLRAQSGRIAEQLAAGAGEYGPEELAFTSQVGRHEHPVRLAVSAGNLAQLEQRLRAHALGESAPGLVTGEADRRGRGEPDGEAAVERLISARDLAALGRLWTIGTRVDWARLWPAPRPRRAPLPSYPYDKTRHWLPADPEVLPVTPYASATLPDDGRPAEGVRYLRPTWEPAPEAVPGPAPRTIALISDDAGLCGALVAAAQRRGSRCVVLSAGTRLAETPEGWALDLTDREQHHRLAENLAERGLLPDAVLRIPGTAEPADEGIAPLEQGVLPFLWCTAALLSRRGDGTVRGLYAHLSPSGTPQPEHAAAGAVLRTLAVEHPRFRGGRVVVEESRPVDDLAEQLLVELAATGEEPAEIALREGGRQRLNLAAFTPRTEGLPQDLPLRPGGTYLVTGGTGALGLRIAEYLAEHGRPLHLVLASRTAPDASARTRIEAMSKDGVSVRWARADVSRADDVQRLVEEIHGNHGALHGIVHAAGVTRDGLAVRKTRADIDAVWGAKAAAAVHLDAAVGDRPLDFFLLFSSLAGRTGNLGQADYACANAFLDEFAALRRSRVRDGRRSGTTVSVCWPLWEDGGMTVDEAARARFARRWNMVPLSTEEGLRAFCRALAGDEACFAVLESPAPEGEPAGEPAGPEPVASPPMDGPTDGLVEQIERGLRRTAAGFLLVDPSDVPLDEELLEVGFDSISLTQLVNEVNEEYGIDLLPTALFEAPTLRDFARHLERGNGPEIARVLAARARPAAAPGTHAQDTLTPASVPSAPQAPAANGARPVAVIGMAGLLPGCDDLESFWRHLSAGDHLVRPVPEDRPYLLGQPGLEDLRGGFLDRVAEFDASFYRISPAEAALMDPQQRLFLETVWQLLEHAGHRPADLAGSATGLFVGVSTSDYAELMRAEGGEVQAHAATGLAHAILPNRVSRHLDLRGPSEAVDTACSSALVALHRAARALADGECELAIAGGVNLTLSAGLFSAFTKAGMLSPDGRCKTFDKDADGYVRGEGAGAVLLKPLDRAEADGDRILAVLRGSAVNHGGRSTSLTAPNPEAQARVVAEAYRRAGVAPATVSYVETHGTGTRLGDPVELEGLKKAFTQLYAEEDRPLPGEASVALGSVKTNIGHLEAAAGIAGVLKVLLSLQHGELPPTLHLTELNPYLRLDGTPFFVNDRSRTWEGVPDEGGVVVHRAGVSSFGFGGTNAHVVLEGHRPAVRPAVAVPSGAEAAVLSAPDGEALAEYALRLAGYLKDAQEVDPAGLLWTLQTGREEYAERLAVLGRDREQLVELLTAAASGEFTAPGIHRGTAGPASAHVFGADAEANARAWVSGAPGTWSTLWHSGHPVRLALPSFRRSGTPYWFTTRGASLATATAPVPTAEVAPAPAPAAVEVPALTGPPHVAPSRGRGTPLRLGPVNAAPRQAAPAAVEPVRDEPSARTEAVRADHPAPSSAASAPDASHTGEPPADGDGVAETIRTSLAGIIDVPSARIADGDSFTDLGLDSIFRMQLVRELNETYGLDLKAAELYECDSVASLAARTCEEMARTTGPAATPAPQPVRPLAPTRSAPTRSEPAQVPRAVPVPRPDAAAGPADTDDAHTLLAEVITRVVGHAPEAGVSFADDGFTSFDMLRTISALERRFGSLRKTLMFDRPTTAALAEQLLADHGPRTLTLLSEAAEALDEADAPQPPAPAPRQAALAADQENGPLIVRKRNLPHLPELEALLARLDREHAKEGGLAGRDIAPLAFLGKDRRGYFNFSRRDDVLFAWSYVGSAADFPALAAEYLAYAEREGLKPNFLSVLHLDEVGGRRLTATPFGAIQRLENLDTFTLTGGRMQRLRYLISKFTKNSSCRTEEYEVGTDPGTDAGIVDLIDQWSSVKQMTNPYVDVVRRELGAGRLDARHRMFLTYRDDVLANAVIVTKLASEPTYLLDLEFYAKGLPPGGIEYAIVRIAETLRPEGITCFSFGASFGVRLGDSPNASAAVAEGMEELRSVGIFNEGNYQFKNKFRPVNTPIYLCQPDDESRTDVSDVILMIANPDLAATAPGELTPDRLPSPAAAAPARPTPSSRPAPIPAPAAAPVPHPAHTGTPDTPASTADRDTLLAAHGHNPLALPTEAVDHDLITDSWAELDLPAVPARLRELAAAAHAVPASSANDLRLPWLPFDCVIPTQSGRAAEALLCRSRPGAPGAVVHNSLFPTWTLTLLEHGFEPVPAGGPAAAGGPALRGGLDPDALDRILTERQGRTAFVCVELSNNARGGYAAALADLRAVRRTAKAHGVPLVLDASRVLEAAYQVIAHEPEQHGREVWSVARSLLSTADAVTLSLSKDFGLDFGGLVATSDPGLARQLREEVALRGHQIGRTARRTLAAALADQDWAAEQVRLRMRNVATLWERLSAAGAPVLTPAAGHAVVLDVAGLPAFADHEDPVASCLSWIFRNTGVRGAPQLLAGDETAARPWIRLAVPVGMSEARTEETGERLAALFRTGPEPVRLVRVDGTDGAAAAYHPADALPQDVRASLHDGSRAADDNPGVLRDLGAGATHRVLTLPEGEVEVFEAGQGTPLLLIHPFNIGAGLFSHQFRALAADHRVIVMHAPGVGRTTAIPELTLSGLAGLHRAALRALGVHGPVHVAGASFGGLTAQRFALDHPQDTASLTLLCSSYKCGNRVGEVNRLSVVVGEDFDAVGDRVAAGDRSRFEQLLLRCESMDPQTGLRYLDVFAQEPNLLAVLPEISVPTLIVQGAHDSVIPLKTAHLLHGAIPDARYAQIEDAGHFPTLTHPDEVHGALREFLAAQESARTERKGS